ncbi:LAMI_0H15148g1_1 [Lachancea mirantina]|uniref:LAMI_0H15148g1_1 n=1 Tax=Lachancea mirantina TaxID=1230905 RepID=A0A1G4KIC7_9SACH|nr:LAMI_0H15148g1_1 [Lachancea mirantina]
MSGIPPQFFKISNIATGALIALSAFSQLTYLFKNFSAFLMALFALALSVPIVYLEFRVPPNLYRFASFYFSFIGRGLLYMLLALLVSFGGVFKILIAAIVFTMGGVFVGFQFVPTIQEPENFRAEGNSIAVGDDDDEII